MRKRIVKKIAVPLMLGYFFLIILNIQCSQVNFFCRNNSQCKKKNPDWMCCFNKCMSLDKCRARLEISSEKTVSEERVEEKATGERDLDGGTIPETKGTEGKEEKKICILNCCTQKDGQNICQAPKNKEYTLNTYYGCQSKNDELNCSSRREKDTCFPLKNELDIDLILGKIDKFVIVSSKNKGLYSIFENKDKVLLPSLPLKPITGTILFYDSDDAIVLLEQFQGDFFFRVYFFPCLNADNPSTKSLAIKLKDIGIQEINSDKKVTLILAEDGISLFLIYYSNNELYLSKIDLLNILDLVLGNQKSERCSGKYNTNIDLTSKSINKKIPLPQGFSNFKLISADIKDDIMKDYKYLAILGKNSKGKDSANYFILAYFIEKVIKDDGTEEIKIEQIKPTLKLQPPNTPIALKRSGVSKEFYLIGERNIKKIKIDNGNSAGASLLKFSIESKSSSYIYSDYEGNSNGSAGCKEVVMKINKPFVSTEGKNYDKIIFIDDSLGKIKTIRILNIKKK